MQLPDEAVSYLYQGLLASPAEEWTPATELRAHHFLPPSALRDLLPRLNQVRSQIAGERDMQQPPKELQPLDAGFIELPQKTLDEHRRKGDNSVLGLILKLWACTLTSQDPRPRRSSMSMTPLNSQPPGMSVLATSVFSGSAANA